MCEALNETRRAAAHSNDNKESFVTVILGWQWGTVYLLACCTADQRMGEGGGGGGRTSAAAGAAAAAAATRGQRYPRNADRPPLRAAKRAGDWLDGTWCGVAGDGRWGEGAFLGLVVVGLWYPWRFYWA
jgi:hypothetical protein